MEIYILIMWLMHVKKEYLICSKNTDNNFTYAVSPYLTLYDNVKRTQSIGTFRTTEFANECHSTALLHMYVYILVLFFIVLSPGLWPRHGLSVISPRLSSDVLEAERARGVRPAEDGELRVCRQQRRSRRRKVRLGPDLRLYRRQRRASRGKVAGQRRTVLNTCCCII